MKKFAISLACIAALAGSTAALAANVLPAETTLSKGQRVQSKNGLYHLIMQDDGNLVLYFGLFDPLQPVWSSNTRNSGWYARMQADGNFVVYSNGQWAWQAGYGGRTMDMNYKLTVGDDGVVAIRLAADSNGGPILKQIVAHTTPYNGGPAYSFPTHSYSNGYCVDSGTWPVQSGAEARTVAFNQGKALGRCSDYVNVYGY